MGKPKNYSIIMPNQMRLIIIGLFFLMGILAVVLTALGIHVFVMGKGTIYAVKNTILSIALIFSFTVPWRMIKCCHRDIEHQYSITDVECRKTALLAMILAFIMIFCPLVPVIGKIGAFMIIIWCICWFVCSNNITPHILEKYVKFSRIAINVVLFLGCLVYFITAIAILNGKSSLPATSSTFTPLGVAVIVEVFFPYYISHKILKGIIGFRVLKEK